MKKFLVMLCLTTTLAQAAEVHEKPKELNKGLTDIPSLIWTGIGGILFSAGVIYWFSKEE